MEPLKDWIYCNSMLFCNDGSEQKSMYCHILTEPQGPTCQEVHAWSSQGRWDSGLVLGSQKPSLNWSSFSWHHTRRCFVPFPQVTRHWKNTTDHYFQYSSTQIPPKNIMINLYIQIQLKIILKDIFPPHLRKTRDILGVKPATPNFCCPNPSTTSICSRNKGTKLTLEQVCISAYCAHHEKVLSHSVMSDFLWPQGL